MAVNLARAIYLSVCISKGYGQHLKVLVEADPIGTTDLLRLLIILQAIGLWTFTLVKLPVGALLVRLFAYSALLDLVFALYPIARISRLQMKLSKKLLTGGSFSLGIV
ncbi:MAG: hypothetical protein Q9190_000087 [Brigantiaea leucoxantha]